MDERDNRGIRTRHYACVVRHFCNDKSGLLKLNPFFQRYFAWGQKRQSLLIETILQGLPMPAVYTYIENGTGFENVIDGCQRLNTVKNFFKNMLVLKGMQNLKSLEGKKYRDLEDKYKNRFLSYIINFIIFEDIVNKKDVFDIFRRYNTGALELNPQEIRNGMYSGSYNDFIRKVSQYKPFLGYISTCSNIKRMIAEELTVRFMAMYEKLDFYKPKMNNFINRHYESKSHLDSLNAQELEEKFADEAEVFKTAYDACEHVFKKCAFKHIVLNDVSNPKKGFYYGKFSKFVFDMQMHGFAFPEMDLGKVIRKSELIKKEYERIILADPQMAPSTYNDNAQTSKRIRRWQECVYKIINS